MTRSGTTRAGARGTPIAVRLTVLGSGSAGNATVVTNGHRGVLLDVGLSYRQVTMRLASIGISTADIGAIVITHAHGDHTRGAALFSRRHGVPVYATPAVRREWGGVELAEWRSLAPARAHNICGFRFEPMTIPHDASETVAFRIETAAGAIGFATDIGCLTDDVVERFRDCRVLVLESNHATDLLEVSPYHRSTRERIAGSRGHLSNEALADFIRTGLGTSVRCIVLAHLSRVNNVPEIAEMCCREALATRGRADVEVVVAGQDQTAPTIDVAAGAPGVPLSRRPVQPALPFDAWPADRGRAATASGASPVGAS